MTSYQNGYKMRLECARTRGASISFFIIEVAEFGVDQETGYWTLPLHD